jgi:M3 family oligoendopeptidase
MKKFQDIPYVRPDFEKAKEQIEQFIVQFEAAKSYAEARKLYIEFNEETEKLGDMYTVASIRNTIDTTDKFYDAEMNVFYEQMPILQLSFTKASESLLKSPFKEDFAKEFGSDFIKSMEAQQKLTSEAIVADQTEESRLTQEYSKTAAQAKTMFRGEECNFYGLLKHMQSPDRTERKQAFEAWADLYASIADTLDEQFTKLVALRRGMAKKLGFASYVDMAYLANGHYYYTAEEVAAFRQQVVDVVVPAVQKLYERQRKHIGVDKLHYYDEQLIYNEGNATPIGDRPYLVKSAQEMYRDLSKETGEFFDFMVEHELFDLETRPGKHMGGYCTFLVGEKAPFIFSNFNGTSADVDVLTHEAGHAFQAYTSSRRVTLSSQIWSTSEISEIHSMTMEHFAYPYMEKFFGDAADKYRYAHLAEALKVVPYLCLVDHFQHEVYAHPEADAKGYRAIWRRLEKIYMPWRDYDGNEFLEEGGFWMQKQHIFLYPFYYVDYAMAQMGAFELYERSLTDRKQAWADYYALCCSGGSKPYFETLKVGNLSNPFAPDTVKKVTAGVIDRLLKADY